MRFDVRSGLLEPGIEQRVEVAELRLAVAPERRVGRDRGLQACLYPRQVESVLVEYARQEAQLGRTSHLARRLIDRCAPFAERLGCLQELGYLDDIIQNHPKGDKWLEFAKGMDMLKFAKDGDVMKFAKNGDVMRFASDGKWLRFAKGMDMLKFAKNGDVLKFAKNGVE